MVEDGQKIVFELNDSPAAKETAATGAAYSASRVPSLGYGKAASGLQSFSDAYRMSWAGKLPRLDIRRGWRQTGYLIDLNQRLMDPGQGKGTSSLNPRDLPGAFYLGVSTS